MCAYVNIFYFHGESSAHISTKVLTSYKLLGWQKAIEDD